MAKQNGKEATSQKSSSSINRTRRNSLERKSLPKYYKVLFRNDPREIINTIDTAWKESRKKSKSPD